MYRFILINEQSSTVSRNGHGGVQLLDVYIDITQLITDCDFFLHTQHVQNRANFIVIFLFKHFIYCKKLLFQSELFDEI